MEENKKPSPKKEDTDPEEGNSNSKTLEEKKTNTPSEEKENVNPFDESVSCSLEDIKKNFSITKHSLISPSSEIYILLKATLQERLEQCHGETIFEIGVAQDGDDEDGLSQDDHEASVATLTSIAASLDADCLSLWKKMCTKGVTGQYLIRKKMDGCDFLEIRIAVVGNVDAGKSTLLGVLTHGELDNGRGYARQKLFRHKHEQETGRTSSVGNDILGFDNKGNVVNRAEHGSLDWVKICESSSKVITFIDLAGHERYLKTTVFGMTGHAPDFGMLMIGANAGLVGMTKEHLGLALALNVPVFVVVTKIDMCPKNVLDNTLLQLVKMLKSPGCRKFPVKIKTPDDVITSASNFMSERLCPIFQVSNVTGKNLDLLKMFLNLLSSRTPSLENEPAEFQIDDTYSVPGVGTVVSGTTLKGIVRLNDTLLLGPDPLGKFLPIAVKSIHRKRMPVTEVRGGQTASFALKKIKRSQIRKGMVMVSPDLNPQAYWEFQAEILVLHHPTTIGSRYQAMVHCGSISQTASILKMSQECLRTGDKAIVNFRFIKHPEYIKPGQKMVFREGRTKAFGTVLAVTPPTATSQPVRGKTGKLKQSSSGSTSKALQRISVEAKMNQNPQSESQSSVSVKCDKRDVVKKGKGRRGGDGRRINPKQLSEQSVNAAANQGAVPKTNKGSLRMFVSQEGPANALALNKDNTQVVVAGRNVFKIFYIQDDEFVEHTNLRINKNLSLNYSCNDVAWNLIEQNILATAATNGAVVLWYLNKASRSKLEHIFNEHKRTVNKVRFHAINPTLLLSGSQDGTMKCFDLRIREVVQTFYSNSESVRDVQFNPHNHHIFTSVSENGNVQLWDLRKPDKHLSQFTAHSGPVFSCDWHPEEEWLATASRDKTIKVWDLRPKNPTMEFIIHTIASIGHVKWRPERRYHLASSSLVVDCTINIWDVRRPYIPFASFDQHKDIPTGLVWKGQPHIFLSTGRDCMLFQHVIHDARRPIAKANPQAISFNPRGDLVFATTVNPAPPFPSKFPVLTNTECPLSSLKFYQTSSKLTVYKNKDLEISNDFIKFAKMYKTGGMPFKDLCDYNGEVASIMDKPQIKVVWDLIKAIYSYPSDENKSVDYSELAFNLKRNEEAILPPEVQTKTNVIKPPNTLALGSDDRASYSGQEEGENEEDLPFWMNSFSVRSMTEMQEEYQMQGDFFFGDEEFDPLNTQLVYDMPSEVDWTKTDFVLPREAFELRHDLEECSPTPEEFTNFTVLDEIEAAGLDEERIPDTEVVVKDPPVVTPANPNPIVLEALWYHVDSGDLQTAVTVLYVLGDKRKELGLDMSTQEKWLEAYVETLARYRLFDIRTELIRKAWVPSINQLNQQSTCINTSCGECGKPLMKGGALCDRCRNRKCSKCSFCHIPVKGLFAWCRDCGHGGHLVHMKEWFEDNKTCPAGCGHICQTMSNLGTK